MMCDARAASSLWLQGAACQEQRLDGGVSLLARRLQSAFIPCVNICAPVQQESDRLQLTTLC